jgi:hypothetical protein
MYLSELIMCLKKSGLIIVLSVFILHHTPVLETCSGMLCINLGFVNCFQFL